MSNALGQLAYYYVKPQPSNLIGDALGDMGNALGDLATSGAAVIGELGSISSKTIATAVKMAAPYIKEMNAVLGDLANGITHL
ncbi:uncharacterized protein LOC117791212 isoform X1 [Drosophila innubila]|uniref:uncharacterized protein LOC117791212 isoform X1 n=1 Tax=Drosophila innubila TaxID=198719 RepID=UPI00148D4268|nr:uncharacterized protein LOC117791212 isoform X1 [Drosophila innubila]